MKYSYLNNLCDEVRDLESADPDCLRKLLSILGNAMSEIARLEDRVTNLETSDTE